MLTHQTRVITTFNRRLYDEYAHRFWDTFPHDNFDLTVYSEDKLDIPYAPLTTHKAFVERNGHITPRSYKQDAVRFCYKPYAVAQCLEEVSGSENLERILWIDADTVFLKEFDEKWIDHHLDSIGSIMTYMGRYRYYSETGLLLFNLRTPHTRQYILDVKHTYDSNTVYELDEQHDSFVWDHVRKQYEAKGHKFNNVGVTEHKVPGGHIQAYRFGDVMDHCKGKRKARGYSHENRHSSIR